MINDDHISRELDSTEKANNLEKYKTALKKAQFINEIKGGLGNEIKSNPGTVRIIKKSWNQKLKAFFKKAFTKF